MPITISRTDQVQAGGPATSIKRLWALAGEPNKVDCVRSIWPVLVAAFGTTYTFSIGNVTAPSLGEHLHAGRGEVALTLSAFAIAFTAGLILSGRLGDRYGRRRLLITGLLGLVVTSALVASASGIRWLIAACVLQGRVPAAWVSAFAVIAVLLGAGQACQYGPLVGTVMASVPAHVAGLAGGLFTTAQQAALEFGVAVIGGIFVASAPSLGWGHAFAITLTLQASNSVVFAVLARHLRRQPENSPREPARAGRNSR